MQPQKAQVADAIAFWNVLMPAFESFRNGRMINLVWRLDSSRAVLTV